MMTAATKEPPMRIKHHDHVVISVFEDCVRCGETHENLDFARLSPAMDVGGVEFTHWALCPINETPILLKVDTLSA